MLIFLCPLFVLSGSLDAGCTENGALSKKPSSLCPRVFGRHFSENRMDYRLLYIRNLEFASEHFIPFLSQITKSEIVLYSKGWEFLDAQHKKEARDILDGGFSVQRV